VSEPLGDDASLMEEARQRPGLPARLRRLIRVLAELQPETTDPLRQRLGDDEDVSQGIEE
jgi:hypothetical protein